MFPGVFSGWDNTPRIDEDGVIVRGSNPKLFQKHLEKIMNIAEESDKEFIFINAWNEWSEGAYLEPDEKYGRGYLDAISKAVGNRM